VRLLLDLEPESDPVWHYLNIQVGNPMHVMFLSTCNFVLMFSVRVV
jgi:hypothetical protein